MLFWRSFTHWIGGMGVLVFVMVLTTLDKKNSMYLMRAEVPGPEKDKLVPRTMSTATVSYTHLDVYKRQVYMHPGSGRYSPYS